MTTTFGIIKKPQTQQAIDPKIKALASAILEKESGGNYQATGKSGEYGAYQFMPSTWKSWAGKHLGNPNAEMTVENQNKVAYNQIKEWKDKGLNPAQIASKWNSGKANAYKQNYRGVNKFDVPYDVPKYVKDVSNLYRQKIAKLKPITPTIPTTPALSERERLDIEATEKYKPTFAPKTEGETAIGEAMKTVGNVPKSAFNFAKGIIDFLNPISNFKKIEEAISETKKFAEEFGGYGEAAKAIITGAPKAAYQTLIPEASQALINAGKAKLEGDEAKVTKELERAQRAITADPVGQIAPFLMAAKGLVKGTDKIGATKNASKAFDTGIQKTAQTITKPVATIFGKGKEITADTAKFTAGQAIGISPESISTIIKHPEYFSKKAKGRITRESVGREVDSALSKQAEALEETGKAYDPIRKSETPVKVSKDWLEKIIKDVTKLEIKKGKFKASGESNLREASDVRAVQHIYDLWKPVFKKGKMTPNEFLNFRTDLANLSKFERQIGKSKPVEAAAKEIRAKLNKEYRSQIKGLEKLDVESRGRRIELARLNEGLVKKNGELKSNAYDIIANAIGKTFKKGELLARLEELVPGITAKLKIMKAIQDIESASGIKVGTYSRAALTGGALVFGGLIQAALTAILTSPEMAVPILRRYGLIKNKLAVAKILNVLSNVGKK